MSRIDARMSTQKIEVYTTTWCGDCRRAKRVLDQSGVEYDWVDIEAVPDAEEAMMRLNGGLHSVPTIRFPDGSIMIEPSNWALHQKLQALGFAA